MEAKLKEADLSPFMISKCEVGKKIDTGSKGAAVLEGIYQYRKNIVFKRMKKKYTNTIQKEIMLLSELDTDPNIVRYYGAATNQEYLYIALERCNCNLQDLVKVQEKYIRCNRDIGNQIKDELEREKLKSIKELCETEQIEMLSTIDKGLRIPTGQAIDILRQMMLGLCHILKRNIVHRDLTPENILLKFEDNRLHAKIADFNCDNNGFGTYGWRSPEQINGNVQTAATDSFMFGCIAFHCITGGRHLFGNNPEQRERNIKNGIVCNLSSIKHILEAHDLVYRLVVDRAKIHDVELHPFFWSPKKHLEFLCAASDRTAVAKRRISSYRKYNRKKRSAEQRDAFELEETIMDHFSCAQVRVLEGKKKWCGQLHWHVRDHKRKKCNRNCRWLSGLLRNVRNLSRHYEDKSPATKRILGGNDGRMLHYFYRRFPRFFFEVYWIMHVHCFNESAFVEYFG